MANKYEQVGLIFPFTSEKFMEAWDLWVQYKKEVFNFTYKGVFSAQMTLKKLTELSGGEEERAIRIIEQAIAQQWQGFYPLHIPTFKENGETKKSSSSKSTTGNLRERVVNAANQRYNNHEQG